MRPFPPLDVLGVLAELPDELHQELVTSGFKVAVSATLADCLCVDLRCHDQSSSCSSNFERIGVSAARGAGASSCGCCLRSSLSVRSIRLGAASGAASMISSASQFASQPRTTSRLRRSMSSGVGMRARLTHMVPMLGTMGFEAATVMIGSLFGPSQVLRRLVSNAFGKNLSPPMLATLSAVLIVTGVFVLGVSGTWLPGVFPSLLTVNDCGCP